MRVSPSIQRHHGHRIGAEPVSRLFSSFTQYKLSEAFEMMDLGANHVWFLPHSKRPSLHYL